MAEVGIIAEFSFVDMLIIGGIVAAMVGGLFLIFTKFAPWFGDMVDKMAIRAFVKRNKIKSREELITFYWSEHEKNEANEYVLGEALRHYDRRVKCRP
jgi:hypothetical protein